METLKQITRAVPPKTVLTATAALIAVSGTAYSFTIYKRLSLTNRSLITTAETVTDSFRTSATIRNFVNPRGHVACEDSRSITLSASAGSNIPSEEVLLSKFVNGFFGGRVFSLERIGLQLLNRQIVALDGLAPTPAPRHVKRISDLPSSLPSMHSIMWGAFQVTDLNVGQDGSGSFVDFVYGSNRGQFAGCHRFTVRKVRDDAGDEAEVFVSMECITCNPTVDKPISGKFLFGFHKIYAMMLFRDAVGEVKSLLG